MKRSICPFFIRVLGLTLIAGSLSHCGSGRVPDLAIDDPIPVMPFLIPNDTLEPEYQGVSNKTLVSAFYQSVDHELVWNQPKHKGDTLVMFIRKIRYYGLLPQDYHLQEITSAIDRLRRDILLTDAFFEIVRHLRSGKLNPNPKRADSLDIALLLDAVITGRIREAMLSQEPDFAGYRTLKKGLQALLDRAAPEEHNRLLQGETYDSMPLDKNLRIVEINLERWRWESASFGNKFIYVNIPSLLIQVILNDSPVIESRAIVGKPLKPTPILSSSVQCFVTYPYWHVPRKISVEEFLPTIQKDTSFISRNNFEVLDRKGNVLDARSVEWKRFHKNNFPVVLRQREGPDNSLGIIKFYFDNPFAVYLHDTNAPYLFRNKNRALSHGCIRMEKAVALAHYLVTNEIGKTSRRVEKYLRERLRHTVNLPVSVPIHIRYFTAEFRDGQINYFEDIYNKDEGLIDLMYRSDPAPYY